METKFTFKDVKKKFKLDLKEASFGDGDLYLYGTAYTKDRTIENVICVVDYNQFLRESKKHHWDVWNNEYLKTIKID